MPVLFRPLLVAALLACVAGALPAKAETATPLERLNRQAFELNKVLTDLVVQPTFAAYRAHVPLPAQRTIRAVYGNLLEPVSAAAFALVGDIDGVAAAATRFAVNTTVGVFGIQDVAGALGFPERRKGFSGAFCAAGLPVGPYLVLPVVGPTTTNIAMVAATLMFGSTYALTFVSLELALVSAGTDMVEIAAALQNVFQTEQPTDLAYDAERKRFLDNLTTACARSKEPA